MVRYPELGANGSSSGSEKLTIAYTESVAEEPHGESGSSSSPSSSSSSLETPTSAESLTSQLCALDRLAERHLNFGYEPVWRTLSMSRGPGLRALDYLWSRSVFQLFSFLLTHLLAHIPEQPVPFLIDLVDRCLRYRDGDGEPPLLFQDSHVLSVYTALDPAGDGSITYRQYLAGMTTLGVTEFNLTPNEEQDDPTSIPKDVFLAEARVALLHQLNLLLGKTAEWSPEGVGADDAEDNSVDGSSEDNVPVPERGTSDQPGKT